MTPELVARLAERKVEVLAALRHEPTGEKPNSPEARGSGPTPLDDLRAVERSDAPTGLLGGDTASPKDCRTLPTYSEAQGAEVIQPGSAAMNGPSAESFAAHARGIDADEARYADWILRPDVDGKLGWEPPDLPEAVRWWARMRI